MLPKEMRCREAADAGAHHNKIVNFLGVGGCGGGLPECAIAKTMGRFKRASMASPKARQLGRVIVYLVWLLSVRRASDRGKPNSRVLPTATAAPLMKSRRVMGRSIPR